MNRNIRDLTKDLIFCKKNNGICEDTHVVNMFMVDEFEVLSCHRRRLDDASDEFGTYFCNWLQTIGVMLTQGYTLDEIITYYQDNVNTELRYGKVHKASYLKLMMLIAQWLDANYDIYKIKSA